jgi:hypothetical protein
MGLFASPGFLSGTAVVVPVSKLSASFRKRRLIGEKLALYLAPFLSTHMINA